MVYSVSYMVNGISFMWYICIWYIILNYMYKRKQEGWKRETGMRGRRERNN